MHAECANAEWMYERGVWGLPAVLLFGTSLPVFCYITQRPFTKYAVAVGRGMRNTDAAHRWRPL